MNSFKVEYNYLVIDFRHKQKSKLQTLLIFLLSLYYFFKLNTCDENEILEKYFKLFFSKTFL